MHSAHARRVSIATSSILLAFSVPAHAEEPILPATNSATRSIAEMRVAYDRAQIIANVEKNHYLLNERVFPTWIGREDNFWYCRETSVGCTYTVVDARTGAKADLFDHKHLAAELHRLSGNEFPAGDLQLQNVSVTADRLITFSAFGKSYSFDRAGRLKEIGAAPRQASVISPDGAKEAFVRDFNIWIRDLKSGAERQLTDDGSEIYAYASKPQASRLFSPRAELKWSNDSSKVLTVQTDDRLVKPLPLVNFAPEDGQRAVAYEERVAFPGDPHVPTFRLVVIDLASGRQTAVRHPDLPAVRMLDTPINGSRAWWSGDDKSIYFVDIERGEKTVRVMTADSATGETRELFRESHPKGYVELGPNVYEATALRVLPNRKQMVWYSERSGAPQLYLYDLANGQMIRQLTSGDGIVSSVIAVDEPRYEIMVSVAGRRPDSNPYDLEIERINLADGSAKLLSSGDDSRLAPEDGDAGIFTMGHKLNVRAISRSGKYWVETQAKAGRLPRTVIKERDGREVAVVEQAQGNSLPNGFRWPEPVMLKAADGVTSIQAIVARPSDFDPAKRYPIIDFIYGGPQIPHVGPLFGMSAVASQQLAELGFIVVVIDGRGTAGRDRAFHEASYGAAQTASNLEDHIAGIRQLAARYPYMDLDRVGINGFSGGGYMTASAMMRFPDFFKVGVAESGNHDQRIFWHSWGERYQGLPAADNYLAQSNTTYTSHLKGKLLLIHGMLDMGVHPSNLFQLTQKLMDENKDFDLVILPRAEHYPTGYSIRRKWDYFVQNLAGQHPPQDYQVVSGMEYSIAETKRRTKNAGDKK